MQQFFSSIIVGALGSQLATAVTTQTLVVIGMLGIVFGVILSMLFPKVWKAIK